MIQFLFEEVKANPWGEYCSTRSNSRRAAAITPVLSDVEGFFGRLESLRLSTIVLLLGLRAR